MQGRGDRGERWSAILCEVTGASGGLWHSDAGDRLRRAEPARAVPAPANDDARATEVGGLHVGWPHDVSHRNGAGSGRDRPAARNGVATMSLNTAQLLLPMQPN